MSIPEPLPNSITVRDSALVCHGKNWMPIPVPFKSKNPNRQGWQGERYTLEDIPRVFNGKPQNMGLLLGEPSDGLVDVDADSKEAVRLAPHVLPKTNAIFGRTSKRRSHYFYLASPLVETTQFRDPADA